MSKIKDALMDEQQEKNEQLDAEYQPEYRFHFSIEDVTVGKTVTAGSTYVSDISPEGSCESIEMELFSALRAFREKIQARHEETYYPKVEEDKEVD